MIERCDDYRRVRKLIDANTAPDGAPWILPLGENTYYLIERDDAGDAGVLGLISDYDDTCAGLSCGPVESRFLIHIVMGPRCRGVYAIKSGLNAIGWMFENTHARDIVACAPCDQRHVRVIPSAAGLRYAGTQLGCHLYHIDRPLYRRLKEDPRWA